jgi:hypothetical protein
MTSVSTPILSLRWAAADVLAAWKRRRRWPTVSGVDPTSRIELGPLLLSLHPWATAQWRDVFTAASDIVVERWEWAGVSAVGQLQGL